ncbi:hypothetical protein CHGG_08225 [Chaetomium globosum CBS 148.51]|uniref:Protamine P1 n=1 Tax=Chaetomium globosum (strain ATCC 6205 / CBS 148.51 / DSM 1962 / NBRC 6347 / NRRL 1970) TaxID=306901 RepID=Q2GUX9_CHAGB|nr:uncharacterized protein CHGG_08225 [Chaetomium globosum CBS 148.51]EAQ86972.1 hypothetical protein CHGG_08225 [Chaetomium globosum CBS 148.51]
MKRRFGTADLEWLHPNNFCDEPIYCEPPHNPDEILYHGSDDEAYSSPTERRLRFETQAERFLEGKPVFLLSASLRGPFDRESGWVNPWRSKSTFREKSARRKRLAVSRGTVPQVESSDLFDSSFRQPTPERRPDPPEVTYTLPRYMDGDAFHRVWKWRDAVVAESDAPTSSIQQVSQPEPTSADSRKATQHTYRRQSNMTAMILNEPESSGPDLPVTTGPIVAPGQVRANQTSSSSSLSPPPIDLLDPTQSSPHSFGIHDELALPDRSCLYPTTEGSPSTKVPAAGWRLEDGNATPNGIFPEATVSSVQVKTQASARADGSFRYRRKGARGKESALGRSSLLYPPSTPSDTADHENPGGRASPTSTAVKKEAPQSDIARAPLVDAATIRPDIVPKVEEVQEQGILEDAPQIETSQNSLQSAEEAAGQSPSQGQIKNEDMTETASEIDGPTLVPSSSPSGSEHLSSMPSFGHFSVERHSQDIISEAAGMPRRLLWPKSRRSASRSEFLPVSKREAVHTPASTPSGLGSGRSGSVSSNGSIQTKENIHPPEENEDDQGPTDAIEDCVQEDPAAVGEVVVEVGGIDMEMATDSETTSEDENGDEDEDTPETEELQAEPPADSDSRGDRDRHMQPASSCPAPQIQSPWATDDAPPRPRSHNSQPQHSEVGIGGTEPTFFESIQSPWVKTEDDVHDSDIPTRLPDPHPANTKLSFMASQALEPKVSQSPWARGDSQLQLPETRLFNHLSSPANSHILPTIDPVPHSQVPHNEDIDMRDSQLYPQPPSTPETKQSSLPTPDFTLSVKSFKNFMTPSPRPATKRRRVSTVADDHLPSTQALVDATISNPWTRPPTVKRPKPTPGQSHQHRPIKRVSWALLPDETEPSPFFDPDSTTTTTITNPSTPNTNHPPSSSSQQQTNPHQTHTPTLRPRATSPPPSILSTTNLPDADDKFRGHFAAVASRRVGATPLLQRLSAAATVTALANATPAAATPTSSGGGRGRGRGPMVRLLPSASQQVCESPGVEAMAEAFLRAEGGVEMGGGGGVEVDAGVGVGIGIGGVEDREAGMAFENEGSRGLEEGEGDTLGEVEMETEGDVEGETREEVGEETQEIVVDEVSAVMENLDDFLGGNWDLDADLAKVRSDQARESRGHGSDGPRLSGLMDVGVWD